VAVREVAAVVQIEREDLVAGIEYGVVDRLVRLRSGVRLDVDVVGAPQLFRAIDRERLDLVGVLAAGVVALARIPLRVLVREDAPLRLQYRLTDVVLAGDHRERLLLPVSLPGQRVGDLGIDLPDVLVVHVGTPFDRTLILASRRWSRISLRRRSVQRSNPPFSRVSTAKDTLFTLRIPLILNTQLAFIRRDKWCRIYWRQTSKMSSTRRSRGRSRAVRRRPLCGDDSVAGRGGNRSRRPTGDVDARRRTDAEGCDGGLPRRVEGGRPRR